MKLVKNLKTLFLEFFLDKNSDKKPKEYEVIMNDDKRNFIHKWDTFKNYMG